MRAAPFGWVSALEYHCEYTIEPALHWNTDRGRDPELRSRDRLGKTAEWYYLSETADSPANSHILISDRPYSQEWPRDSGPGKRLPRRFAEVFPVINREAAEVGEAVVEGDAGDEVA